MSENNEASIESNCFRGGFTLKASRLGGAVLRPPVLGPSVIGGGSHVNSKNSSTSSAGTEKPQEAKPSEDNPFLREQKDEDDVGSGEIVESTEKSDKDEIDERPDPLTMLRNNGMERSNIFAAAKTTMPRMESSGFVFGQNVHERVVGENIVTESKAESGTSEIASATPQLLFSSVIQKAAKTTENNEATGKSKEVEAKSLTDVAREYEESRAQKRKYEEVETFTGEENEINIVDVSCKLFAFVNSNWEERGRGSLRLNDAKAEDDSSRVVFRTSGNLRLLLNTKVWAAMVAERASQKSLRLTAMDNTGTVKIFLAMGRPADIAQLHKALSERIIKRKLTHPEECAATGSGEQAKNGLSRKEGDADCATSSQPESTTNDDEDDDADDDTVNNSAAAAAADGTDLTEVEAQAAKADKKGVDGTEDADSTEPSPKKPLVVVADSSADVKEQEQSSSAGGEAGAAVDDGVLSYFL
ncbi:ran-binding protein 3 [Scaptodrosophila lebanonensis]|uniref:Ran-binding protein 3 n=1 Tax=Drosophila lebanonensis TaxID=7225 RepID=A0A6J2T185_DROLE|nr:ran-binding protein 3 [Scaptodrosophila lebanonensis]